MTQKGRNHHNSSLKHKIIKHINENINIYFKIILLFIIGICLGITVVNQLPEIELQNINIYINNSISLLKSDAEISKIQMLKSSLYKNILIVLVVWIFGPTFFGNIILYFIILIIGVTFGYTIAAIMTIFTFIQGILFFFSSMFLQNIINIPAIFFLIVQGIKSRKHLLSKQNIGSKYIIIKHSAYSVIVAIILTVASLIEVYISGNLIYSVVKYL